MKYKIEIKWAIIFSVVGLIWMSFENAMGWHGDNIADHATYTSFFAVFAIIMFVLALLEKRNGDYNGIMTWKQGFMTGMVISIIITLISPLSQLITHNVIAPEYFPNVIDFAVSSGNMTQMEAEAYFNMKSYMMQAAIGSIAMGILTSAIVAFFLKKDQAEE